MYVCYVEHKDKNVRAELIWRLLIATTKMSIHIFQSKFYFHVQRSLKHTITYLQKNANIKIKTRKKQDARVEHRTCTLMALG